MSVFINSKCGQRVFSTSLKCTESVFPCRIMSSAPLTAAEAQQLRVLLAKAKSAAVPSGEVLRPHHAFPVYDAETGVIVNSSAGECQSVWVGSDFPQAESDFMGALHFGEGSMTDAAKRREVDLRVSANVWISWIWPSVVWCLSLRSPMRWWPMVCRIPWMKDLPPCLWKCCHRFPRASQVWQCGDALWLILACSRVSASPTKIWWPLMTSRRWITSSGAVRAVAAQLGIWRISVISCVTISKMRLAILAWWSPAPDMPEFWSLEMDRFRNTGQRPQPWEIASGKRSGRFENLEKEM